MPQSKIIRTLLIAIIATSSSLAASTLINPDELSAKIQQNPNLQILDARSQSEFNQSHLRGATDADLNNEVEFQATIGHLDKSKPVYTYGINAGGRGSKLAEKLSQLGFKEVYELNGGISRWIAGGKAYESNAHGLSVQDFQKQIQTKGDLLVFVHGNFCAGCQKLSPIVDNISQKHQGNLKLLKVELFENPEIAKSLKVNGVPTLILYRDGKPVWQNLGITTQDKIESALNNTQS